eukprot:4423503-Ditylum_brightwellii.AAC.1
MDIQNITIPNYGAAVRGGNGSGVIHADAPPAPNSIHDLTATFGDGSKGEESVETPLIMTSLWEIV